MDNKNNSIQLTEEQQEYLKILLDPVAWAETTLRNPEAGHGDENIKLRYYQKEIIASKSKRKVVRAGRRLGKTAAMVCHMLHFAFTHEESVQIFATPYDNQAKLIYDELCKFIDSSPMLKSSLKRKIKSPYEFEFNNKAVIKGFTAGTRSGQEGGSLRGQKADYLYLDEIDYMTDADFEAIYAIALEDPDRIGVWCSSTPTGRRGVFWKMCTGVMEGWTEFYYPCSCNPKWGPKMERELKNQYSEQGYIHECLAEFGEETVGVFKKEDIDRAQHNYEYGEVHYNNNENKCKVFIGVDWDKYGAETTILVDELRVVEGIPTVQVIDKILIPKSEYTFDNAINKIIELNDIYDPEYIYIDRGSGEYQLEALHKKGLELPGSRLHEKVVGVSLGSSRQVIDPATGDVTKKPLKAFMVNQVTLLFERGQVVLNANDEKLTKQFENYRVVRTSLQGVPVFSDEDEHGVDCLGFTVLAILDHYPDSLKLIDHYKPVNDFLRVKINKLVEVNQEDIDDDVQAYTLKDIEEKQRLVKVPVGCKDAKKYIEKTTISDWGNRKISSVNMIQRSSW